MKLQRSISYDKVKERFEKERDGRVKHRLFIILKAFKIKSSYKIAELADTSHTKVQRWIKRFNKSGFEGLKDRPRSGKPSALTKEQKQELEKIIENPGEFKAGFNTIELMDKIEKRFGVKFTPQYTRRMLKKMRYNLITPRPYNIKKDTIKGKEIVKKLKKNSRVWAKNGTSLQETNSAQTYK